MVSAAITGTGVQSASNAVASSVALGSASSKTGMDFRNIMNISLNGSMKNENYSSQNKLTIGNAEKSDSISSAGSSVYSEQTENASEAQKNDSTSIKEDVSEAVADVKDKIKEELGVSDEDIKEAMENLGMTLGDLLMPQKVTQLLAELSDTDTISFITDDSMLLKLNEVLETVNNGIEQIAVNNGLKPEEVIEQILNNEIFQDKEIVFDDKSDSSDTMWVKNDFSGIAEDKQNLLENDKTSVTQETVESVIKEKMTVETSSDSSYAGTDEESNGNNEGKSDIFDNVSKNLSQSIQEVFSVEDVQTVDGVSDVDIVRQVVDQIKLTANRQITSIEVMLNPENLGSVHVTVSSKNGIVSAQLAAQNEQVKVALENQMTALKEHFNNQGLKVDAVEVTVQSHSFEANSNLDGNGRNDSGENKKTHRKLDLSGLGELNDDEMTVEELRTRDSLVNGESSVVYSA
ncbi:MAG: flagellar hook-length control protein FliK [Eubacteriales bacterium]|nr:flagellar hook-length control protein FliK [Eubacteriales bacterium]